MTGETPEAAFFRRGWVRFPREDAMSGWVAAMASPAARIAADPLQAVQWRCGGTWFAGVDAIPNDESGAVPADGVPPLAGAAVDFVAGALGLRGFDWDRGQLSICTPGYPAAPMEGESEAAFRYRVRRDAAHVDGLERFGDRRRRLSERHGFILGIPLASPPPEASPMVVWEGSHEVIRAAFRERLAGIPPARWSEEDVTEAYHAARARIFEDCPRVALPASAGESYIVHRLALHGVAPWGEEGGTEPRPIAYFRPDPLPGAVAWWLEAP